MAGIITMTTDFGTGDAYAAVMKGVILDINPEATIVDITHEIAPQAVPSGAFVLSTAYPFFPLGTIHVAVVDPGVGTERRSLILRTRDAFFVAPDNGLLSYVLAGDASGAVHLQLRAQPFALSDVPLPAGLSAYEIQDTRYFRHPVSDTFHGRDIFAPVAAHLSLGVPPGSFGPATEHMLAFLIPRPYHEDDWLIGTVLHVDRFGNLISNLRQGDMPQGRVVVEVGSRVIDGMSRSYAEGAELVAVIGSRGYLEVAVPNGDASRSLGVGVGGSLRVRSYGWSGMSESG